ncbi:hypothetical protein HX109_09235 [Galbibacter sp. BG1]|uniref:hypothetical protein n=1 Tax=Galbibacter sp. BG1 TaxID=1170699 RepID=UPI0015BB11D4|nr:hypothetical protein [Galbibacter sp. BG1]QLE01730.1 hypothetical protein HX109_09235 [Galbibacter sp. BG1]
MNSSTFKIEKAIVSTEQQTILWNGNKIPIHAQITFSGYSHRFRVYFVDKEYANIPSTFMSHQKLVIKFEYHGAIHSYSQFTQSSSPVYAFYDTLCPELNCITARERSLAI